MCGCPTSGRVGRQLDWHQLEPGQVGTFAAAQLSQVEMSGDTWQDIRADYQSEFGTSVSQSRTDVYVEFRPRVTRRAVGSITVPQGGDGSDRADGLRDSQRVYLRALSRYLSSRTLCPTTCTRSGTVTLVLRTLAELENPIRVATMTMLLWPDTTLTQRPHQLRMGDAVEIDVAGFADFHAVVAGLAWRLSADNIPEIEVVALETPATAAASAVADRQHQRHVGRRPDGDTLTWTEPWRVVG